MFFSPGFPQLILKARSKVKITGTYSRLEGLSKQMARAAQVDLEKGIRTFKSKVSSESLLHAWQSRSYGAIMETIPWQDLHEHFDGFENTMQASVSGAANWTIRSLPAPKDRTLRYDAKNPAIQRWIKTRTGERIVGIQRDTQDIVARMVQRSFTKAYTPRQVAMHIKDSIGLDPRRELALANYREQLDLVGTHKPEVIDKLVEKYGQRLLNDRTMVIGRTETRKASNQGQLSVWRAGADQGFFDRQTASKVWVVDGNPCEICEPMDGIAVPLDGFWTLNTGDIVDEPTDSHPNCLCGMELEFDTVDHGEAA